MSAQDEVARLHKQAEAWKLREAAFVQQIIDLAHYRGYMVAHFRPALTAKGWRTPVQADGAGFPDLVLCHPTEHKLIFLEAKSAKGKATQAQLDWLEALDSVEGVTVRLVRSSEWSLVDELFGVTASNG